MPVPAAVAEFDARKAWAGPGLRSCAHWLSCRVGMDLRTTREQVRVARVLPSLPQVTAAFGTGRISYAKARAITRIATPQTEGDLLEVALAGTASHIERVVRLARTAGAGAAAAVTARRSVSWAGPRMVRCYCGPDSPVSRAHCYSQRWRHSSNLRRTPPHPKTLRRIPPSTSTRRPVPRNTPARKPGGGDTGRAGNRSQRARAGCGGRPGRGPTGRCVGGRWPRQHGREVPQRARGRRANSATWWCTCMPLPVQRRSRAAQRCQSAPRNGWPARPGCRR